MLSQAQNIITGVQFQIKRNESVGDQVMNRVESLLADIVFVAVVVETEVFGDMIKSETQCKVSWLSLRFANQISTFLVLQYNVRLFT